LRPAVDRGAALVIGRDAQAVTSGGVRCASQVLGRGSQVVACCAATLSQQEKNNSEDLQQAGYFFPRVKR
jgi:hypothetical protein